MINGNEYAWEDVQLVFGGESFPIDGFVGIEYTSSKEHTNIHGRGAKPVAMGRGREDFSGTLTVLQSELERLQRTMPRGVSLTKKAPFDLTVAYAPEAGEATVDQLKFCRIGEVKKGMRTGDGNMTVELPLVIGDIKPNV